MTPKIRVKSELFWMNIFSQCVSKPSLPTHHLVDSLSVIWDRLLLSVSSKLSKNQMDPVAKQPNLPKRPAKNKSALLGKPVLLLPGFQTYVMYDIWRSVVQFSSSIIENSLVFAHYYFALSNLIWIEHVFSAISVWKNKIQNHKTVVFAFIIKALRYICSVVKCVQRS